MIKIVIQGFLILLLAFGAIFLASIASDPSLSSMSRDGGVFAYCGQRITQGALLYRDCWDNKPPAIYYLNALVIAFGGNVQWNLWLLQAIWLSITAVVFFITMQWIWSGKTAIICTVVMLLTVLYPIYFSGGNLTETFALLPITLILGAFWGYLKSQKSIFLIGIGLFTAAALLFKPTYVSMGAGAVFVLIYSDLRNRKYRELAQQLVVIGLSIMLPLLATASYWIAQRDLGDLLFAVFTHNQLYVEQGFTWKALLVTIRVFILEQPLSALFALAMISLLVNLVENWEKFIKPESSKSEQSRDPHMWLMACLAITFVFDFIFTTLPGTNFRHYFLIPILTLSALAGYLVQRLFKLRLSFQNTNVIIYVAIFLICLPWLVEVIGKEIPSQANLKALISNPGITDYQPDQVEEFILQNTTPDQSILVWDYDPKIYLHVVRRSPTRFIFLRHIFTPIPGAPNGFAELMQSLQRDPPEFILSSKTSLQGLPYLGVDESQICDACTPVIKQAMVEFKRYVDEHYQAYIDIQDWLILIRRE